MIISILTRKVRNKDRKQWQSQLAAVLPKIRQLIEAENGFLSLQYAWDVYEDGLTAQTTTWETLEDCQRYVRAGAAADVATLEEAAIPTALHPNGAWVRSTLEVVSEEGQHRGRRKSLPSGIDIRQKGARGPQT